VFGVGLNIGDKESSSDLETGAEPHRLELEEEFGRGSARAELFIPCSTTRAQQGESATWLEFLILRINISKISLSSGGLLAIPLNLRCAPFFASFFLRNSILLTFQF